MLERDQVIENFKEKKSKKPLIDVHSHAGFDHFSFIKRRYPSSQSVKDLVFKIEHSKVDFAVTFPCPNSTYYFDLKAITEGKRATDPLPIESFPYEFTNRQLFYEVSLFGADRILPFAIIYPGVEEDKQIESLEEYAKRGILFGLKHHTSVGSISAKKLIGSPLIDFARIYNLPVIIHSGVSENARPENIMDLAEKHQDVRFCIAHAAEFETTAFDRFIKSSYKNVFIDTSPFISICASASQEVSKNLGSNKLKLNYDNPSKAMEELYNLIPKSLVWGTDEPWTTITDDVKGDILVKVDYQDEVHLLHSLSKKVSDDIAYKNTIRFLFDLG